MKKCLFFLGIASFMITNSPAYTIGHNQGYILAAYTPDDLNDPVVAGKPFMGTSGTFRQKMALFGEIYADIERLNEIANNLENPTEQNVLNLVQDYHNVLNDTLVKVNAKMSGQQRMMMYDVHHGIPEPLLARIEKDMKPIFNNHFTFLKSRDFTNKIEKLAELLSKAGYPDYENNMRLTREECRLDAVCPLGTKLAGFISQGMLPVLDILIAALEHENELN
jgi:hypothetical protein